MTNTFVTFGLEIAHYDSLAESDAGKEVVLATPLLSVFASSRDAIAKKEGINIVEGDLHFFAFDGSPLKAIFSQEPCMYSQRNTYFPGIYTLQLAHGEYLQDTIAKIISENPSPHAHIVVRMPHGNESAQEYGWSDIKNMKDGIVSLSPKFGPLVK